MSSYFIESFKIDKLWGDQNVDLLFKKDVNILIGPNGSGKTTILNLLHFILSGDLRGILNVNFEQAKIKLRSFKGKYTRTITVKTDTVNRILKIKVGRSPFNFDMDTISTRRFSQFYRHPETGELVRKTRPIQHVVERRNILNVLTSLVPIVWLPISRHLPTVVGEEERDAKINSPESADSRLPQLVEKDLPRYYANLNAQLSERYREFEHQALSGTLYNKKHDQLDSLLSSISFSSLPTESEKTQLLNAFEATGFLDEQMSTKIDDYFTEAGRVLKRISERKKIRLEDVPILPIIRRTQAMVESARKLEEYREGIFIHLKRYEGIVNSFLDDKSVEVDGSGQLKIRLSSSLELDPAFLSSGEKQILILLTEALLKVDKPVVYIADEPELSLHVTWQEKLLESLVTLGGQKQIIVATHSPDIVGKFRDNVITLGKES